MTDDELDDDARGLLLEAAGERALGSPIFRTLVRNRSLFRRWMPFAGRLLLKSKLSPQHRELAVLRTLWLCDCGPEHRAHSELARSVGVTEGQLERIAVGPDAEGWSPLEAALLRAADELHERAVISNPTWAALAAELSDDQLIEVCMLIGHYHLVAFTVNSLHIEGTERGAR